MSDRSCVELTTLASLPCSATFTFPSRSELNSYRTWLTLILYPSLSPARSGSGIGSLAQLLQTNPSLFPPSLFSERPSSTPAEEVALANAAKVFTFVRSVQIQRLSSITSGGRTEIGSLLSWSV